MNRKPQLDFSQVQLLPHRYMIPVKFMLRRVTLKGRKQLGLTTSIWEKSARFLEGVIMGHKSALGNKRSVVESIVLPHFSICLVRQIQGADRGGCTLPIFESRETSVFSNKHIITVGNRCSWQCLGTSKPRSAHLARSLYLCSSGSNTGRWRWGPLMGAMSANKSLQGLK